MQTTRDLCLKLATTLHLSVAERRALPNGRAPISQIIAVVEEQLRAVGWFPKPVGGEDRGGDGVILELRQDVVWIHERHEVGAGRYSPVQVTPAKSLEDAVRVYILAMDHDALNTSAIDGVPIDWSS